MCCALIDAALDSNYYKKSVTNDERRIDTEKQALTLTYSWITSLDTSCSVPCYREILVKL
jgi:hypothetical protein